MRSSSTIILCTNIILWPSERAEGYSAHSVAFIWGERGPQSTIPVRTSMQAHGENWRAKMSVEGIGTLYSTSFPAEVSGPMLRLYDPAPFPAAAKTAR